MSHNLAKINGKVAFAAMGSRQAVWHALGNYSSEHPEFAGRTALTWSEMLTFSGLDWEVFKNPVFARPGGPGAQGQTSGNAVKLPVFAIFRSTDGLYLGIVGPDYVVKQNRDCFQWLDTLVESVNGAHYDTAGALGNGAQIFCTLRLPGADISVAGVDKQETRLVFTTSHDMSISHTGKLASTRVVCQNTLQAALSESGANFRIKHTASADRRMAEVSKYITGATVDAKTLESKFNLLASRAMTKETLTSVLDKLFPKPAVKTDATTGQPVISAAQTKRDNLLLEVLALYESNDKDAFPQFRGSAYNLLNAVTEWTDHVRGAKITEKRADSGMSVDRARAENAITGSGDALKTLALQEIIKLTADNPSQPGMGRVYASAPIKVDASDTGNWEPSGLLGDIVNSFV